MMVCRLKSKTETWLKRGLKGHEVEENLKQFKIFTEGGI